MHDSFNYPKLIRVVAVRQLRAVTIFLYATGKREPFFSTDEDAMTYLENEVKHGWLERLTDGGTVIYNADKIKKIVDTLVQYCGDQKS